MGALGALIVGCSEGGLPLEAGNGRTVDYAAAGANAPTSFPWFEQFDYVDPCSGLDMVVTITGTAYLITKDGRQVFRIDRTISTSTGFQGTGTSTDMYTGRIESLVSDDVLAIGSGQRFRVHFTFVADWGTNTIRVDKGGAVCLGPSA
jgi:hypothetical protein